MSFKKRIVVMLSVVMMLLTLTACGSTKEAATSDVVSSDVVVSTDTVISTDEVISESVVECTESKSTEESAGYPVTVTDSNGDSFTIEKEPMKIISMAPNITELIYQLGVQDKLVGRTDYCDFPAEVSEIESVGSLQTPDIEKIISLKPDLVIASTHFSDETQKQLTDLGIKVMVLYEEHELDGVYTIISTMGTVFQKNTEASALISEMQTSIDEVTKSMEGLEAPTVYYVVGFGEYGDYTAGGDTYINQLLTLAGGKNIAEDVEGWSYSLEALLEADPDIIIISNEMKDSFMTAENYKDLSAVKNNQVYGINNAIVERQGYRNLEGIKTLAQIFHPDVVK